MDGYERAIGALEARAQLGEARLAALETRIDQRLDGIEVKLSQVHEAVASARGSWRTVAWLVGAIGTLSAVAAALFHWILPR